MSCVKTKQVPLSKVFCNFYSFARYINNYSYPYESVNTELHDIKDNSDEEFSFPILTAGPNRPGLFHNRCSIL